MDYSTLLWLASENDGSDGVDGCDDIDARDGSDGRDSVDGRIASDESNDLAALYIVDSLDSDTYASFKWTWSDGIVSCCPISALARACGIAWALTFLPPFTNDRFLLRPGLYEKQGFLRRFAPGSLIFPHFRHTQLPPGISKVDTLISLIVMLFLCSISIILVFICVLLVSSLLIFSVSIEFCDCILTSGVYCCI